LLPDPLEIELRLTYNTARLSRQPIPPEVLPMPPRWSPTAILALLLGLSPAAQADDPVKASASTQTPAPFSKQVAPFLAKYCVNCHGSAKPKADLNLSAFGDEAAVVRSRKLWMRLKEFVEAGEMPPEEHKLQPSQEEVDQLASWIDGTLAKVNCQTPADPGRVTIRRLNRAEYNNTIRDLVGIDFQPADDFPSDDVGYGFDNIGDVLTLPPMLLEKYLEAAESIAEKAIVASHARPLGPVKTWEGDALAGDGHSYNETGRMLASAGSVGVTHAFPVDSEYILRARAYGQQAGPEPVKMAFQIDGKPLKTVVVSAVETEPKVYEFRAKLRKGERKVSVAFLNDYYNEKDPNPSNRDRNLIVEFLEVQGPAVSKNAPLPDSHKRIICKTPTAENRSEVAVEIIERFATRAYRRPLLPGEVARLVRFVDMARANGESFERGIQLAVEAVLVSPQFLFRVELGPQGVQKKNQFVKPPNPAPVTDFELASRLSYFLWSSMPDDELFALARNGKLREGDNLDKQVARMLRDRKAQSLVENFADQWLQIRNLKNVNPDRTRFPTFDEALRTAMQKETELFFEAVIREDRSVLDLIDADFTFLNERLARHYGIPGVKGEAFQRVALKDGIRGGLLTQASILTVTSNPTRTSPVKRGKWILEQVLGAPPPPPPPDVPILKDDRDGPLKGSLRQRMEQHRANPSCASCHSRMDPLGFGFENFDAIGAWREKDGEYAVDASGVLPSGQTFQGPKALKAILKAKDKDFCRALTEKLLTYALGRGVE
jgi:mono/diheme cytochrome c family protein